MAPQALGPSRLLSLKKARVALMQVYGELERIARLPRRPGFLINSDPSAVVLCFQPSSFLWQSRSPRMVKRQDLVIAA